MTENAANALTYFERFSCLNNVRAVILITDYTDECFYDSHFQMFFTKTTVIAFWICFMQLHKHNAGFVFIPQYNCRGLKSTVLWNKNKSFGTRWGYECDQYDNATRMRVTKFSIDNISSPRRWMRSWHDACQRGSTWERASFFFLDKSGEQTSVGFAWIRNSNTM